MSVQTGHKLWEDQWGQQNTVGMVWNQFGTVIYQNHTSMHLIVYNLDTHEGRQVAEDCDDEEKLSVSCIKINSSQ